MTNHINIFDYCNEIHLEQGTPEWLEFRHNKIGSSISHTIMGKLPWKNKQTLWDEEMGIAERDTINLKMERGIRLEPLARECFIQHTGIFVKPSVFQSKEYPWLICSVDGISRDYSVLMEAKCGGLSLHESAIRGELPTYYMIQCQHHMAVTGLHSVHYWSFDGYEGALVIVHRDDAMIADIIRECKIFWDSMQSFTPPTPLYSTIDIWQSRKERIREARAMIKAWEMIEANEKAMCVSEAFEVPTKGNGITLMKVFKPGCIDYKQMAQDHNLDIEKYRKKGGYHWSLKLDKEKDNEGIDN